MESRVRMIILSLIEMTKAYQTHKLIAMKLTLNNTILDRVGEIWVKAFSASHPLHQPYSYTPHLSYGRACQPVELNY